ncbi:MAG: diguanylate cyclase [Candidatus Magnetomorum sp.]|nr:diguanylate cyclase [Candidatus Magnetomorum sp.]
MAQTGHDAKEKILIVDDVPLNIHMVKDILSEKGYLLSTATNGRDALEKTQSEDFDLILLDVRMPDIDGFEVCKRIRAKPEIKDIPIIFLTGEDEARSIIKGFEVGAMDYVTKPFYSTELLARVRTHLELSHSRKALKNINLRLIHEIDVRKKIEEELRSSKDEYQFLAEHDNLTGLYNTRYLYQTLNRMIKENNPEDLPLSLIFMDIDNFKCVVDTYGHLNGSRVIQEVARSILTTIVPPSFAVAYAGDEFVIVLPGYDRDNAVLKAETIRECLRNTTYLSSKNFAVHLSASFGIAIYPDDTSDLTRLLSLADQAMFDVKAHGKDAVCASDQV